MMEYDLDLPEDEMQGYWTLLERTREKLFRSLSELEIAALNQDVYEYRAQYIKEMEDAE